MARERESYSSVSKIQSRSSENLEQPCGDSQIRISEASDAWNLITGASAER